MLLKLKCISCKQHIVGSHFFCFVFKIYSSSLCLLIDIFRPFILKVIIDMLGLKSAILLFVFCLFPLFLFSYFLVGYVNIF